ncbi:MAG: prepilin-type N-terminal cleavage/methylation domain-containing protein [Planctomycetota bacterium]
MTGLTGQQTGLAFRPHSGGRSPRADRAGFSMVELLVVLAVVVILTSFLMPAIGHVRENANRIVCASNLRQIGTAMVQFAGDNKDRLPFSDALEPGGDGPLELMASHRGETGEAWDGIGLLFEGGYCGHAGCFYCPSHHGTHTFDEYEDEWQFRLDAENAGTSVEGRIYTNYHYAGHLEWSGKRMPRLLSRMDSKDALSTDGLRSLADFNHIVGMNVLRGDGSVNWYESGQRIRPLLPETDDEGELAVDPFEYDGLWQEVQDFID